MSAIAESGAEQIPVMDEIVEKLKEQGYDISKSATSSIITGVNVGQTEVELNENKSITVIATVITSENSDVNAYYVKIDGLYYKMTLENEKIEIGESVKEIVKEEVEYEVIAISNDESIATVNVQDNKIIINAVAKTGNTFIDVKVNGKSYKTINVKIIESWETLSKIAKAISNDQSITYQSDSATVLVEGTRYTLSVGQRFLTPSGKTVCIAGFNHDNLSSVDAYRYSISYW